MPAVARLTASPWTSSPELSASRNHARIKISGFPIEISDISGDIILTACTLFSIGDDLSTALLFNAAQAAWRIFYPNKGAPFHICTEYKGEIAFPQRLTVTHKHVTAGKHPFPHAPPSGTNDSFTLTPYKPARHRQQGEDYHE